MSYQFPNLKMFKRLDQKEKKKEKFIDEMRNWIAITCRENYQEIGKGKPKGYCSFCDFPCISWYML